LRHPSGPEHPVASCAIFNAYRVLSCNNKTAVVDVQLWMIHKTGAFLKEPHNEANKYKKVFH